MSDYSSFTTPDTLRLERILPGPIERVWSYLTDSEKRSRWLASGPMDLRNGGSVELTFQNSTLTENDVPPPPKYAKHANESRLAGRITACDPPHLLAFTWGDSNEASEVRFELSALGKDVRLILTHSRLDAGNRDELLSVSAGWHTHIGLLIDQLGGRTPSGFWATFTRLEAEYDQRIPAR